VVSSNQPIRIAISGAAGRMGRTLINACDVAAEVTLGAAIEHAGSDMLGRDCGELAGIDHAGVAIVDGIAAVAADFDLLVEFTRPEATIANLRTCAQLGKAMVIGTTGLNPQQIAEIEQISTQIPVVFAPNMSIGVNVLFNLLRTAAAALGNDYDVEIIEAHHRHKIDAPSGTALKLGEIVATALGRDLDSCAVYGREGETGARDQATIGFSTIRGGDIVGDHTVLFAGEGERIELTHKASSRMTFAQGAIRAASWLAGRGPGLYSMQDVLGLSAD